MALYDWLKVGHILGAMVWLGGGVMLVSAARRARARNDPASIGDFARSLAYLGPRVLAPAAAAVLVFGVWMVLGLVVYVLYARGVPVTTPYPINP